VPGTARGHTSQRVLEHGRLGRIDTEPLRRGEEGVRRRLAFQALGPDGHAVDDLLDVLREPGDVQHLAGVGARRHHGPAQPCLLSRLQVAAGAFEHVHALGPDPSLHGLVLPVAEAVHGHRGGWVVGRPFRQRDPARGEEVPDSVDPWLAVDVGVVLRPGVEGPERDRVLLGIVTEELVEHLFPRLGVDGSGVGEHAVQIEQAGPDLRG